MWVIVYHKEGSEKPIEAIRINKAITVWIEKQKKGSSWEYLIRYRYPEFNPMVSTAILAIYDDYSTCLEDFETILDGMCEGAHGVTIHLDKKRTEWVGDKIGETEND